MNCPKCIDFIAIARERLSNNGRNQANKNAGIRVGSDLHLCQELLAEVGRLRSALQDARSFVELSYDENGGNEAADARHVLNRIDALLPPNE